LILAFVLVFFWFLSLRKRKKAMPSHVELYFQGNFRKIMDEWDFTTRDRVKDFKKDMSKRLSKVGGDIDVLETKKKNLDKRMDVLEKQISSMEGL
jgi:hypothetical protein